MLYKQFHSLPLPEKTVNHETAISIHPKDWEAKTPCPINQEQRGELFTIRPCLYSGQVILT